MTNFLKLQGGYYVLTGIWPILHMKSFEAISGRKTDHWLVKTVGALIAVSGAVMLAGSRRKVASGEVLGLALGQAAALAAVDVNYSTRARISKIYLADAAVELALMIALSSTAWTSHRNREKTSLYEKTHSRHRRLQTERASHSQREVRRPGTGTAA